MMSTSHYQLLTVVPTEIFRAYDVRGIVPDTLDSNTVYTLGVAIGSVALEKGQQQVIVARDGRISGPDLKLALIAGLLRSGCDVIDIGMVPTPLLYFATHMLETQSGVMITGSHNPTHYNGLKIVIAGETQHEQAIYNLHSRIQQQDFHFGNGQLQQHPHIIASYVNYIAQRIHLKRPLNIGIDCGNGVTGVVAATLFRRLGCEVTELFGEVDGHFPNHHPDPSEIANLAALKQVVQEQQLDVGLAFDGDGDRLGVITNTGEIIFPDRQLMLFAIHVLANYPQAKIIYDVKSSYQLDKVIQQHNGIPMMWRTGHSVLKAKMFAEKSPLAGEFSGHIFFNDRWFGFDDALYSGVRLLEILSATTDSASQLFATIPNSIATPELKIAIAEEAKFYFMEQFQRQATFPHAMLITIDGVRAEFADGWGLLRSSNTSPYLIARFEAEDSVALARIQHDFKDQILRIAPQLDVTF